MEPKTYRYAPRRPEDGEVRVRLRALAGERRRFGYRRLHILLAREGVLLNHKRLFHIYREARKALEGGRRSAHGATERLARGRRWRCRRVRTNSGKAELCPGSLDFVSDALACRRRFRVLAVVEPRGSPGVDDFTRECLSLVVRP